MPLNPHGDAIERLAKSEPRAFTFGELASASSLSAARTAIANGVVVRLMRNTYVAAEHSDSLAGRTSAALRWLGPPAAIGGLAALYAFRLIDEAPSTLEVIVPVGTRRACPYWLRLTCASYEFPVAWWGDWPVATPGFALAQAFGHVPRTQQSDLVFGTLRSRTFTVPEARLALTSMPRVRDRRRLARLLDSASAGAESHLEHVSLTSVFNTKEFSTLIRQHHLRVDGQRFRLDMYDAQTRTAIELDGAAFHDGAGQRERDLRRDAALASVGILTIRLSYRDVTNRPEWCRATVRATLRARRLAA
jgi:very-short-patch-repair endonuclease